MTVSAEILHVAFSVVIVHVAVSIAIMQVIVSFGYAGGSFCCNFAITQSKYQHIPSSA